MGFRSCRYNENKIAEILGVDVDTIKGAMKEAEIGTYAKVWSVEPVSDMATKCRISISRKDKNTGEYTQDYSGFVLFIGTHTAKKAAKLKSGDKIKLLEVDVSNKYDSDKNVTYNNFKCFSFDVESSTNNIVPDDPQPDVDGGEVLDDRLPF